MGTYIIEVNKSPKVKFLYLTTKFEGVRYSGSFKLFISHILYKF